MGMVGGRAGTRCARAGGRVRRSGRATCARAVRRRRERAQRRRRRAMTGRWRSHPPETAKAPPPPAAAAPPPRPPPLRRRNDALSSCDERAVSARAKNIYETVLRARNNASAWAACRAARVARLSSRAPPHAAAAPNHFVPSAMCALPIGCSCRRFFARGWYHHRRPPPLTRRVHARRVLILQLAQQRLHVTPLSLTVPPRASPAVSRNLQPVCCN